MRWSDVLKAALVGVCIAVGGVGCGDSDAHSVVGEDTAAPPACSCTAPGPCQTAEGAVCSGDGACVYPADAALEEAACDDGDACTAGDVCAAGVCAAGPAAACDDSDPCNGVESCNPATGCADGEPLECDDGDVCNGAEACKASMGCVAGESLFCDDGDLCNGVETCHAALGCVEGAPLQCDDGLVCNGVETCSPASGCGAGDMVGGCCKVDADCEDGNACNGVGLCDMATWTCRVSPAPACDDGNPCNGAEACDPASGCTVGAAPECDDGDACNGAEICDPGAGCLSGAAPLCDDGNPCNGVETCWSAVGCVVGAPLVCDDGDACNGIEVCDPAGGCSAGAALQCDDGLECTGVESCDAKAGCVSGPQPEGCCTSAADCDDGDACNGTSACDPATSACVMATATACDDGDPCTIDACDPATGACESTAVACDDGNACTVEACGAAGACEYGFAGCDDSDACTVDTCEPALGCQHAPLPCDDGNACNGVETCHALAGCMDGPPVQCDDWNVCNGLEVCDAGSGACLAGDPMVCTDGNPCNGSEYCEPAIGCLPGKAMSCDDGDPCTIDSCDEAKWMCDNHDVCAEAMKDPMMVYTTPDPGGNSFACNTCHALDEPSEDGVRRVGHRLGDATHRPSYKNGQLQTMRAAANSCRTGWMNAPEWGAEDPSWLALYKWLDEQAPPGEAPVVVIDIVEPPADPTGGDAAAGQGLFNMACVMCHGTDAVGTDRGPPLAGTGLPESYVALRVRTSGMAESPVYDGLTGGIMPFWGGDRLTDDEVRNLAAFVKTSAAPDPDPDPPDPVDPGPECAATHSKVGWTATLSTKFHGVEGVATIVDDCTIELTQFSYDGNGIDVQVYAATAGDYGGGFSVSGQLYNYPIGYSDETVILKVPTGKTLDDIDGVSVWCVAVGVSFGDGLFEPPPDPDPEPGCGQTHPNLGWTATLATKFHGVKGIATIVDDCTILVDAFYFDGNGIDVQVYAAPGGSYKSAGFSVSDQLYNFPIGYADDTLVLTVPTGHTLDDVGGISVWCVAVGVSFGDGLFAPP